MDELLANLKRFLAAGDVERSYRLTHDEVVLIVDEIDRLRGTAVPVLTFDDIRNEVRAKHGRSGT